MRLRGQVVAFHATLVAGLASAALAAAALASPAVAFPGLEGEPLAHLLLMRGGGRVTAYRGAQIHSLWGTAGWSRRAPLRPARGSGVHRRPRARGVTSPEMIAELNALQSAGANVLRVDVGWASLEVSRHHYESGYLAKLDALARDAKARRIKLLVTLWWTPRWASAGGAWNDPPSNPADYGDFARFITARYGSELVAVEAWNEPNWHDNLIAADVPLAYAEMIKAFYKGAKRGDSAVQVLVGSMAYADLDFLGELYRDGIKGYYDAISLHPYADGAAPENTLVTHSFLGGIQSVHLFQVAHGDDTREWVTEFGWPVGTSPGANTQMQQARYIERAFQLTDRLAYLEGAVVYQLRDMTVEPANPEDNFGLFRANLTPRPSYKAFKKALHTRTP
jgi:polysaccharide biosynthesis protein PslG